MPVNIMGLCNPYILHYLEISHKRHRISSYMTVSIEVFVITKFCKLLKQIRSCKRILLTNNSECCLCVDVNNVPIQSSMVNRQSCKDAKHYTELCFATASWSSKLKRE